MKTFPVSPGSSLSRLIALPAHRSPGSSLSRLIALPVLLLLLTLPARVGLAQSAPQATSISVGGDDFTRLLWPNPDGSASVWGIDSGGGVTAATYGPFPGNWACLGIAAGADNLTRALWISAGGNASLWTINADGTTPFNQYGPFSGWTCTGLAVGPDKLIRASWTDAAGDASLWTVQPDGSVAFNQFGAFPGWTCTGIAVGADGLTRALWTSAGGNASLWTINADGSFPSRQYGPFSGWTCTGIAVGPDNKTRALWSGPNGSAQVWVVNADGTYTSTAYSALPTNLTATPGDGIVSLDWDAPTVGGDSYNLYRGTSPGGESLIKKGLNVTPYQDTGLADGVTYYYQVAAVTDKRGGAPSAEIAVTPHLPAAPPASRLTQAQAIALAQTFCQAVGAPVTATATASWPAPNPYPGQPPYHWQNRWDVQFGSQADVEVVDATGVISHYYNFALSDQLMSANNPAGTPVSASSALQSAASALQASGQSGELVSTPTGQNFQITDPPTQAGGLWTVTWGRQFQGIPYRQQQATAMLQAETGALQAFSLSFPSPPPGAGPGSVTSSQAAQKAQTTLANAGYSNLTQQSVTLQVVQPNNQWHTGAYSQSIQLNPPSRVAWNCVFTDANNTVYEVWVDATYQSLAIDGGEVYGLAGLRRSAAPRHPAKPHIKTHAKTQTHAKAPVPKRKTLKSN